MSRSDRSLRTTSVAFAVSIGLTLGGAVAAVAPAQAAGAEPTGLSVSHRNSSTPILSWNPVGQSVGYEVQVDDDPSFGSPDFTLSTTNTKAVPTSHLQPGENHWRVRTKIDGRTTSEWRVGRFQVSPVDVPVPTSPRSGQQLQQPGNPPLLRWQASRQATGYIVEVDTDEDFIGAKSYTTQTTSLVIPDPLAEGDHYWRVTAQKSKNILSTPSAVAHFRVGRLAAPEITFPVDNATVSIDDVVLDWNPVPGAQSYDVQVAKDKNDFNNYAHIRTGVRGTRYSPTTTLEYDQFWWRVRAVDAAGQTSPWRETQYAFRRAPRDAPRAVHPIGPINAPTAVPADKQYFEWTPVPHASYYELYVSTDENFTTAARCEVLGTTYAPRNTTRSDCQFPTVGTLYWQVRARDLPYRDDGLPGLLSEAQAFTWTEPEVGTWSGRWQPVTGQKISMTGSGASNPAKGCTAERCTEAGATPVFSWDRTPGATSYIVYFAQDPQFTTTDLQPITTTNNMLTVRRKDRDADALPEADLGEPHVWYVRPCVATNDRGTLCGPSPVSQTVPLEGTRSFAKRSPAVTGLQSSSPAGNDITFSWEPYHLTNLASTFMGEKGTQSDHIYRIQVDDEPSFTKPLIDQQDVDQATYTAFDKLYPEGTLYWRVQAVDAEGNGLTWSETKTLTKASPLVTLRGPIGNRSAAGTTAFEWDAQTFATQYVVEVYRNNDTAFSPGNRVFSVTTRSTAYAWNKPLPASSQPYVWRVRRIDSSRNHGPWSTTGRFTSLGAVPELLTPANGALQPPTGTLLEWSDLPSAASYQVRLAQDGGRTQTTRTVGTAYAPSSLATGNYTWSVEALDSDGKTLGTSPTRSFRIDTTAPSVTKVRPGKLRPKSTIRINFSEPVAGVTQKTFIVKVKLQGKKKAKKVKGKVTLQRKGTVAVFKPTKKLKRGQYVVQLRHARIKDAAGNTLVKPSKITLQLGR